jgi:hypothetical protein
LPVLHTAVFRMTALSIVPPTKKTTRARKPPAGKIAAAVASGDERKLLDALRDHAAKMIDDPDTRATDVAVFMRQLRDIAKELKALDAKDGGDAVGDAVATPDEEFPTS